MTRQDRAERTRNAILDAAAEIFDERGFNGASLSEILAKAKVTKGALYFHFSSKEELGKALIEEQYQGELPTDTSEGVQAVINLTHFYAHNLVTNVRIRASNRLVTEAMFAQPAPDVYNRWIWIVREQFARAQQQGDLRKEWDTDALANWITGSFVGTQLISGVLARLTDVHDRVTVLWQVALPGLVPPRRLSRFNPAGTIKWDTSAA